MGAVALDIQRVHRSALCDDHRSVRFGAVGSAADLTSLDTLSVGATI